MIVVKNVLRRRIFIFVFRFSEKLGLHLTMKIRFAIFLLLVLCATVSMAQTKSVIDAFVQASFMKNGQFGIVVDNITENKSFCSYNADKLFTPASVMKTVTTATALQLLGDDFQFETVLEYDGQVTDGVLSGNLYIRGGGDPTLGSSYLPGDGDARTYRREQFIEDWINVLKSNGITAIKGNIVSDERIFDDGNISLKWLGEDLGTYYGAGSFGINVFDNVTKLVLSTEHNPDVPEITDCYPYQPSLKFRNFIRVVPQASDSLYIVGLPFSSERYLFGKVPPGKKSISLEGDIPDPALFLAEYFTRKLEGAGIIVTGKAASYRLLKEEGKQLPAGKRIPLAVSRSPKLKEIVRITNYVSHNLYADALLKTIGLKYEGVDKKELSSFDRGIRVLLDYWKQQGLDNDALVLYDGSGLSVSDKLTPRFIADVLAFMATRSPHADVFYKSLPMAGMEGSVRYFLKETSLQGSRMKSGSMSYVRSYAGYVEWRGMKYAVVVAANNYKCSGTEIRRQIGKLLVRLFESAGNKVPE